MKAGLDVGSRRVKLVIRDKGSVIRKSFSTLEFYRRFVEKKKNGLELKKEIFHPFGDMCTVFTGYGSNNLNFRNRTVIGEIKAHVLGASVLTGLKEFTLLDIGGQDVKVALVKKGKVTDFLTNDRCAASSGRYLENMAHLMDVSVEEIGQHYEDPARLNSTCAIYSETELISLMIKGEAQEKLMAGVNFALFNRIRPLLEALISPEVVLSGGVAVNHAIGRFVAEELNVKVTVPEMPEFTGAIGCVAAGEAG